MSGWKQVSARSRERCKVSNAHVDCCACLHEPLIIWLPRQITPWGWLNTIALASTKPKVCVSKRAGLRQKLAEWKMVITHDAEAANSSFFGSSRIVCMLNECFGAGIHVFTQILIKLLFWKSIMTSGCLHQTTLSLYEQCICSLCDWDHCFLVRQSTLTVQRDLTFCTKFLFLAAAPCGEH